MAPAMKLDRAMGWAHHLMILEGWACWYRLNIMIGAPSSPKWCGSCPLLWTWAKRYAVHLPRLQRQVAPHPRCSAVEKGMVKCKEVARGGAGGRKGLAEVPQGSQLWPPGGSPVCWPRAEALKKFIQGFSPFQPLDR